MLKRVAPPRADHATNIAEDVIFVVNGRIVRHHVIEFSEGPTAAKCNGSQAHLPQPASRLHSEG